MCDAKTVATGLQVAGVLSSAQGTVNAGNEQAGELEYRAAQERQNAGQEMAAASSRIADQDRAGKILESRMRAVAGASGVSMSSPTVVGLVSQAAGLTEYNKSMELFNAQTSADKTLNQANADIFSAGATRRAARTRATGTILSGASSIAANYR